MTFAEAGFFLAAGVLWFAYQSQWRVIDPSNVDWMINGDWAATYHGFLFHIRGPLTLPPGLTPNLLAPFGSSVFYTNSIFWLSALGRVVGLFTNREFQLYGLFFTVAYAGLGLVGWWMLRRLGAPLYLRLSGGLLLLAEPMLPARFGHVALQGQAVVMLQVAIAVVLISSPKDPRRLAWLAVGAALFSFGVEGYLAAISLPLVVANFIIARWRCGLPWRDLGIAGGALVGGSVVMLWLVGGILSDPVNRSAEGFGQFSSDLLTLINPHNLSRWMPSFPVSPRQGEGFGYLGVGTIALAVVGLVLSRKATLRAALLMLPMVAMAVGEAIYAASSRITVAGGVVLELPTLFAWLDPLPSMFRTSGRFIWPLHYLVGLAAVAAVVVAARRRAVFGLAVPVAALLQLAEIPARPHVFDPPPLPPPLGASWEGLKGHYAHLQVVPVQVQWVCGYDEHLIRRLSQVAARERMSINSGLVGRVPAAIPPLCNARFSGPVRADTVYVVQPGFEAELHGARCGLLEGVRTCVAPETPLAGKLPFSIP